MEMEPNTKTLTIPAGTIKSFTEDRVYKVLADIPHYVTSGFTQLRMDGKFHEAMNLLLRECIVSGPIPTKDGKGWKIGPITDEYLNSKVCSGAEMSAVAYKLQLYYEIDLDRQMEMSKRLAVT